VNLVIFKKEDAATSYVFAPISQKSLKKHEG